MALTRLPFVIVAVCSPATGCVPYPVYKTLQPASQITVLDERQRPVEGATVALITNFNPYGHETAQVKVTDRHGTVSFEQRDEWQQESLMMHGARFYFWNWCVQKPGFVTYETGGRSGNKFEAQASVQLAAGRSASCRTIPES
jgi:hypothetical protein